MLNKIFFFLSLIINKGTAIDHGFYLILILYETRRKSFKFQQDIFMKPIKLGAFFI